MRVCLVLSTFPQLSETFITNKFIGLLHQGVDVHIVCSNRNPVIWQHFPQLKAVPDIQKRVHVSWPAKRRWFVLILLPILLLRVFAVRPSQTWRYLWHGMATMGVRVFKQFYLDAGLIEVAPDILHFEFGALAVNKMYLRDLLGCKVIVSFRGYDLNFSGLETPDYYREVWEKADHLHFLGDDLWQRAVRHGCPSEKPHTLISPAIDTEVFQPQLRENDGVLGSVERPVRLLSVGRLEWKKGYEYALQAIRVLREQGLCVEYRIVGAGKYLEAIAFARHDLGLEDCVYLMGAKSRDEVLQQMQLADILMHSAVSEGFCNAVIEAQAMMLPVVTSDAGGLGENVVHGITGFVVPRRHPTALADRIAVLASDGDMRRQMGKAGRQRVVGNFALEHQIASFSALYKTVYNQPKVTRASTN